MASFGIIPNIAMAYYVIRYKRLRKLTISGILMFSAIADALMLLAFWDDIRWIIRETAGIVYFPMAWCNAELLCECQTIRLSVHNYDTLILVMLVFILISAPFVMLPAAKSSLLLLSIDRMQAVFQPMAYRKRNHAQFSFYAISIVLMW